MKLEAVNQVVKKQAQRDRGGSEKHTKAVVPARLLDIEPIAKRFALTNHPTLHPCACIAACIRPMNALVSQFPTSLHPTPSIFMHL